MNNSENIIDAINQIKNSLDDILDSAYKKGQDDGYKEGKSDGYVEGCDDAWDAMKGVFNITESKRIELFGSDSIYSIILNYSASEVLTKLREYKEQEKQEKATDEIHVGDEFKNDSGIKCVITRIEDGLVRILWSDGSTGERTVNQVNASFKKTGRHFPQIDEVLKYMDEEPTSNNLVDNRLCMACKYADLDIDEDICEECFFDNKKPNFEEGNI